MTFEDRSKRINRDGPALLWQQVAEDIAADITSGKLKPGARLPTEFDLSDRYGVARVTIRRAMAELRHLQLVTVVHGRGTFVADR